MSELLQLPFFSLSDEQKQKLIDFGDQMVAMNQKLNLVSAESANYFVERHILHSLCLAKRSFPAGSIVVDWGTGGGLPGIPLAVCFPETPFYLVDSIGKKIQAVKTIARRLGIKNVHPVHTRAEAWDGRVTHAVSRATAPLSDLWSWTSRVLESSDKPNGQGDWPRGLICLKGGDLTNELHDFHAVYPAMQIERVSLNAIVSNAYFLEKEIIQVTPN